jgi:hypothetical protein
LRTRYHPHEVTSGGTDTYATGTLAGAGLFRCEGCDFAIALHELDEVPDCPHCGGRSWHRGSIFGERERAEASSMLTEGSPGWLPGAREALEAGAYLAFEDDDEVQIVEIEEGWTRLGRSLAADVRFDDPTVSRRHALIHRDEEKVRILDDRSLNGVFLNGHRIDWHVLADGDEIGMGRFQLHYLSTLGEIAAAGAGTVGSSAG